jgi:hypothetical protein
MEGLNWMKQFPAAVTICDCKGVILDMNDKAAQAFENEGGYTLVGTSLLDCHPEPARSKVENSVQLREERLPSRRMASRGDLSITWFGNHYAGL